VWGDGGWGSIVRDQTAAGEFGDDLVEALVEQVAQWQPDPMPTWITCVPSRRQPDLVPSLARRFADAMGLPFVDAVKPSGNPRPQSEMDNSAQQYGNVLRAFAVTEEVPDGPVFLVDDTFDSRWTLTVVTSQLRGAGAGAVFPIVLAEARSE
jgi:ATP-dependent DNA helicase RecQ